MYLKLALRNAKRSAFDYLLYIFTVTILIAIMCISNCIAAFGEVVAGFQTASLSLLLVFIMVMLVDYINNFMVKQRAKELATYMLLGMEKRKLSLMFFIELSIIGAVCFVLGIVLGMGVYYLCFHSIQTGVENQFVFMVMANSFAQTFVYFCLVELLATLRMKQKLFRLQINQLMNEKRQNQSLKTSKLKHLGVWFITSLSVFFAMLCGIVFIPDNKGDMLISILAMPMLCSIFMFYKWVYTYFSTKRVACTAELYQGIRLYHIAEITSNAKTSASINFIFCSCLLFSATSFVFGVFLLNPNISVFSSANQQWMGFLQISICIIFMVIYFSILSLLQIVELKQQAGRLKILHYMGKNNLELRALVRTQILTKLFLPTFMCFVLIGISAPLLNIKINAVIPTAMHNMVLGALGGFIVCFIVLYMSYFIVVYTIGGRYIKGCITYEP